MQKKRSNGNWCRILVSMLALLMLTIQGCGGGGSNGTPVEPELKTVRDDYGVWFISGSSENSLFEVFEAMGYAVATDRLWQAELYRRQARGCLAEIFGAGDDNRYLETDIYMRTIGYSDQELTQGFNALDQESRDVVAGYVAGFNRRITEIKADNSLLPYEFAAIGENLGIDFIPADWQPEDILAWIATLQRNFDPEALDTAQINNATLFQTLADKFGSLGAGMFNDLRWANDPEAQTYYTHLGAAATADMLAESIGENTGKRVVAGANLDAAARAMALKRRGVIDTLKDINAFVKMGSYAWVVSGEYTESGNPIIYSGPQMGFSVPSIVQEGSVRAGGLNVSGMTVTGIPGIIIGRTPHHAWSMQVGHAHTTDYYAEDPETDSLQSHHRIETIKVAGGDDVILPVYRSAHGPIVNPMPFVPDAYDAGDDGPIFAWKYAHWGYEFDAIKGFLDLARAESMDAFGKAIENLAVSQHFCYVDRDGNIAYWMSGRNPQRPEGEWRLPQGIAEAALEWDAATLKPRAHARNPEKGYYGGWNNKSNPDYDNAYNSLNDIYGPFHRSHVIYDFFEAELAAEGDSVSFEEVRDLAHDIATTDSFGGGGNPWKVVKDRFTQAVTDNPTDDRTQALGIMNGWDGHFVAGGKANWATGQDRAPAWILMDAWIDGVMELTVADELGSDYNKRVIFNLLLHEFQEEAAPKGYNWFHNEVNGTPGDPDSIIVAALDSAIAKLGGIASRADWGKGQRGLIEYTHDVLGQKVHQTPFSSRSTYAHCAEYGADGPVQIESMFALGQSGNILADANGGPVFDENCFSMAKDADGQPILYDLFVMRAFPLFD
jgi:penicillin amidase